MATVSGSDTGEGEFVMLKRKLATLYVLGNVFNVLTFIQFVFFQSRCTLFPSYIDID